MRKLLTKIKAATYIIINLATTIRHFVDAARWMLKMYDNKKAEFMATQA